MSPLRRTLIALLPVFALIAAIWSYITAYISYGCRDGLVEVAGLVGLFLLIVGATYWPAVVVGIFVVGAIGWWLPRLAPAAKLSRLVACAASLPVLALLVAYGHAAITHANTRCPSFGW